MATVDTEILKAIGALQEAVKNLVIQAERLDDKAQEHREIIYGKLDELQKEIGRVSSDLKVQENRVDGIEPKVSVLNSHYERSQGAKGLGKFIWTVIIAIIGVAVTAANQLITYFHGH
jgi:DNA repair ATPase RecN